MTEKTNHAPTPEQERDAPERHAKTCDRWVQCGDHEHYESIVNCTCTAPPSTQPVAAEEIYEFVNVNNMRPSVSDIEGIISRHFSVQPVEEHKHNWVGAGDYGDTAAGLMCAKCGVDFGDAAATADNDAPFRNDPTWDNFQQSIENYRDQVDAAERAADSVGEEGK